MVEEALRFGAAANLVGIVTFPERKPNTELPAVILLNAGEVHRAGPNRLYVSLARRLASMGYLVLRFDFSWIDWHEIETLHLGESRSETNEAMDFLQKQHGVGRFVLAGICAGGDTALGVACADERVASVVAINSMAFQESICGAERADEVEVFVGRRKALRYYLQEALFDPKSWSRLLRGRSSYKQMLATAAFQIRTKFRRRKPEAAAGPMGAADHLRQLAGRGGRVFFISSEGDTSVDYLEATLGDSVVELEKSGGMKRLLIPNSDHIFSLLDSRQRFLTSVCEWLAPGN